MSRANLNKTPSKFLETKDIISANDSQKTFLQSFKRRLRLAIAKF